MPPTTFVALLLGLSVVCSLAAPPNFIVVYTDDHGWPDIGSAGIYDDLETPHLDTLAKSGVRATNGYSTAPQCVPSRAGLLAGRAQNRFGVESNAETLEGFDAQKTIAERLKEVGYATGQIGKWHLGPANAIPTHGFDDVYAKNANRPCFANFTLAGKSIEMQTIDDPLYHLDACSQAALAFIRRHADQPFFLYLAYRAPHVPLDAPEKYLSRFPGEMPERRRQALAMISAMDDGIGLITKELKSRGLAENTLIFFIGDNGAPLKIQKLDAPGGGPGWDGSLNEPMNGEKGMLTEGGLRVPYLVSWPGTIPGNQTYDHPVTSLDVAATAAALAGIPDPSMLDGVNLVPYLTGEKTGAPHQLLTWRWIAQSAAREGKWKFLKGGQREYLFDLDADPSEQTNLLSQFPEVANRLRSQLTSWADHLQPPGLTTKEMSGTWERYYDFYLDKKPIEIAESKAAEAGGWTARNASLQQTNQNLVVTPDSTPGSPFLTNSKIKFQNAFQVQLRAQIPTNGKVRVGWRLSHEKAFEKGNLVSVPVVGSEQFQEVVLDVPAIGEIVHVRIHLPEATARIETITLGNAKHTRDWSFAPSR
ncbi:MAG: sulfatase-like hydrolase/transferase [Verrucomicrobiota bacterium]